MDAAAIINRIVARRGQTVDTTPDRAYILGALNDIYEELNAYHEWPWFVEEEFVRTWPLKTFTADADPVTDPEKLKDVDPDFTTAEQAAYAGGYVVGPGREFHRISSFEDVGDTLVMSEDWIGAVQADGAFEAWQDTISLGTGCDHVLDVGIVHEHAGGYSMEELTEQEINRLVADRRYPETTDLLYFSRDGLADDRSPRIRLWPVPRVSVYLKISYKKHPAALTDSAGSIPDMPLRWHHALVLGTVAKLAEDDGEDPQKVNRLRLEALRVLEAMVGSLAKQTPSPRQYGRWDHAMARGKAMPFLLRDWNTLETWESGAH